MNKPTFLETSLDRLRKAEMSWEILYLSSHHLLSLHTALSLFSSPAECEVITVLLAGGENDYNLYGKQRL